MRVSSAPRTRIQLSFPKEELGCARLPSGKKFSLILVLALGLLNQLIFS